MIEVLRLASHIDFQTYSEQRLVPVSRPSVNSF